MSLVIRCKCSHGCGNMAKLSIDEDAEVIMLHVGSESAPQGVVLNRQDLVNMRDNIDQGLKVLSPRLQKLYGMTHVQMVLPGMED